MREFLEGLTFSSCSTFVVLAAGDIGAKYALGLPGLGILILGPIELSVKMRLDFSFQHSLLKVFEFTFDQLILFMNTFKFKFVVVLISSNSIKHLIRRVWF